MQSMNSLQRIFLILFVISTVVVLALALTLNRIITIAPSPTANPSIAAPTPGIDSPENEPATTQSNPNNIALFGSVLASVTSLVGFVMTTVITWRKEKREAALADVERRKLETELEKSRLELEKLRKTGSRKK